MDHNEARKLATKIYKAAYQIDIEILQDGKLPDKKHQSDAGFDLYATEDIAIYPGQIIKHPLNIRMKLPLNSYARIESKSGLGSKGLLVFAGIIDEEYRGIPHVIMTNVKQIEVYDKVHGNLDPILIKKGEKVAQMLMNVHSKEYYIVQVDNVSTDTERSTGGFGSTGK